MMKTEVDKFQPVFEPDTTSGSSLISLEGAALASIAISLKRIADAVVGDSQNTGIHRAILDVADHFNIPR